MPRGAQHGRQSTGRRGPPLRQTPARSSRAVRRAASQRGGRVSTAHRRRGAPRRHLRGRHSALRPGCTAVRGRCARARSGWPLRGPRGDRELRERARAVARLQAVTVLGACLVRLLPLAVSIAKNRAGAVPRPSWCTYLVSYRCNARCGMCDSWRLKPRRELAPREVAIVFGKICRLDVVRLTGGEPFLRADLGDIAETVMERSRPSVLHITSNGSRPDAIEAFAQSFSRPKQLRFLVSLDGLAAEHDQSRGEDATFETALETVRRLTRVRRDRGIDVAVNHTVISAQSIEDHAELRAR